MPLEASSESVGMVPTNSASELLAETDAPGVVRARVRVD